MNKMKLLAKKTMGLLLATLVAFGVVSGTTQAFAGGDAVASKQADKYTEIEHAGTVYKRRRAACLFCKRR